MYIESLELKNYRNYQNLQLDFDKGTNIFYGDNAQGKTNILESVYLCGTTKSHRGSKDKEIIRFGEEESHIRMMIRKDELSYKIDMHLRKNKAKGVAINGLPIKKARELFGIVNLVFFSPEDLGIIKDGPEKRRRFMDMELCQLNKAYLFYLKQYKKVLKQRNALLKQTKSRQHLREALDVWDIQLVDYGRKIIQIREEFINELQEIMSIQHANLTGGKEDIKLVYRPNCSDDEFENSLFSAMERDAFQKTTTVGPHRDDLQFLTQGEDLRKYGSQGQKRTAALSLKMAEIQIVEEAIGEKPILLLDDVLSELDRSRQNYLLENIKGIQTIITCTGLEEFVTNGINIDQKFEIVNGGIQHG